MPKLDRYLLSDFTQSFFATLIVLLVVSVGGVLVDILGNIADGRIPARLLLSQLGLQFVAYLPLILPLALMLGLLLSLARLYRDSEMAVITAIGVGPRRLLRPILLLAVPVVALIGACSLWLGPLASATAEKMLEDANRSVVVAGLEAGRFTPLSGGGIVYLSTVSADGTQLGKVFMQRQKDDRLDVVTAERGAMFFEGKADRYLRLEDGHRIEGPAAGDGLDYRLMKFARNEVALPDRAQVHDENDPEVMSTASLLGDGRPAAKAQLHWRITPPLLALAFALLTLPLSRSAPRQQRYGRIMLAFVAYLAGTNLMIVGTQWVANGKTPAALGLWWLSLPLLALAVWMYARDGRLSRPRRPA
ncbi:MAG TPA: LPS export ABC transporter permease LptF [Xanthomonadaceae bacterium]|nr:LPS export ABC transporter permease LptF [Xanthomonadaceae bacterium]